MHDEPTETTAGATKRRDPERLIGQTVAGRYRVEKCIGRGGMGVVYTARQNALDRRVVIKVVRSEGAEESSQQRFHREAKSLSRLSHPNIVQIYDHGYDEPSGLWFIAMEYVRGTTLSRYLKGMGGRLTVQQARVLFRQILAGVREAHRIGLIHRDLKPSNIMLTTETKRIEVKLLDFGLSKLAQDAEPLTQGHQMLGSAMYMAPEHLKNRPLTPRADVYALGVILYRLLSGQKPITGSDHYKVIAQQLAGATTPLAEALPDDHGVPRPLIELVDRCLSVDPDLRPKDAGELLELLESAWAGAGADPDAATIAATVAAMDSSVTAASTIRTTEPPNEPTTTSMAMSQTHARVGMYAGLITGGVGVLAVLAVAVLLVALLFKDGLPWDAEPPVAVAAAVQAPDNGLDAAANALRQRGLAAMRDGDYDRAVALITEAVMMAPAESDLKELLTIAIDLRDQRKNAAPTPAPEPEVAEAEPEPTPSPRPRSDRSRQSARQAQPAPSPRPAPTPAPVGTAVITSLPKGARVEIDGVGSGVTPYRALDVPAGVHRVTFFVDGQAVHSDELTINDGGVELLDVDLGPHLPEPEPEPEVAPPTPAPAPVAASEPEPEPEVATTAPEVEGGAVGELFIVSENVYGVIWVNGKKVGPPPIVAKKLPVGPATIEVRVGKNVRRTQQAVVAADERTKISIR